MALQEIQHHLGRRSVGPQRSGLATAMSERNCEHLQEAPIPAPNGLNPSSGFSLVTLLLSSAQ